MLSQSSMLCAQDSACQVHALVAPLTPTLTAGSCCLMHLMLFPINGSCRSLCSLAGYVYSLCVLWVACSLGAPPLLSVSLSRLCAEYVCPCVGCVYGLGAPPALQLEKAVLSHLRVCNHILEFLAIDLVPRDSLRDKCKLQSKAHVLTSFVAYVTSSYNVCHCSLLCQESYGHAQSHMRDVPPAPVFILEWS